MTTTTAAPTQQTSEAKTKHTPGDDVRDAMRMLKAITAALNQPAARNGKLYSADRDFALGCLIGAANSLTNVLAAVDGK